MRFWKASAIIIAATIGEGIFALPYVFREAGWLVAVAYLVTLSAVVIAAHLLYLETLRRVGEKERLIGLARHYLGKVGFWIGAGAVLAGLLLTLVAYLILGPRFLVLAFPSLSPILAFFILWIAIAIPVLINNGRAVTLEVLGVLFVVAIVLFVFGNGIASFSFSVLQAVGGAQNIFLPFGILILALAGWTGIEPLYESTRTSIKSTRVKLTGGKNSAKPSDAGKRGVIFGTVFAALLYILFVIGITGGSRFITPDTLSGIITWVAWKRWLIAALGLFAIGTGSVPLTHELRNAMEKDLGWHYLTACFVIIFLPATLVLLGLNNFITVLGLAGGCFIALQYLLIIFVGRSALKLALGKRVALDVVAVVFIGAIIYQIATFIVK